MAKVTNPLHSSRASGDFAKAIQYVCGRFARMKPRVNDPETELQTTQRSIFTQGAIKWSKVLTRDMKNNWKESAGILLKTKNCLEVEYPLTGYNLWMLYWLKFGEDGWVNYPNPPF